MECLKVVGDKPARFGRDVHRDGNSGQLFSSSHLPDDSTLGCNPLQED